ncbi:MAG: TPM domain-containing protein [Bacillota bacterium]|nr:TPM domain-containing protein [Bacillota bacterium]
MKTKRRFLSLTLMLFLLVFSLAPAFATPGDSLLIDETDLFDSEERQVLKKRLNQLSETYQFDFMIAIVDQYDTVKLSDHAAIVYEDRFGSAHDGAILALALEAGKISLVPYGSALDLFSDEDLDAILDRIIPSLNENRNLEAMELAIDLVETVLRDQSGGAGFGATPSQTVPLIPKGSYIKDLPRVVDQGDFLTPEEEADLERLLRRFVEEGKIDVAIVLVRGYPQSTIKEFADDYFDYQGYGFDTEANGALLAVSIEPGNREVWLSTHKYGEVIFTESGVEEMLDRVVPHLKNADYKKAGEVFAQVVREYLKAAEDGTPYDPAKDAEALQGLFIAAGIAFVVTAIVMGIWYSTMKNIRRATDASGYSDPTGLKLTYQQDVYLHTSVTRVRKQSSNSSGGGGGSSSSGRSHGGGGRSF